LKSIEEITTSLYNDYLKRCKHLPMAVSAFETKENMYNISILILLQNLLSHDVPHASGGTIEQIIGFINDSTNQ